MKKSIMNSPSVIWPNYESRNGTEPIEERDIIHNARALHFPLAGLNKITVCSRPIFKEAGFESVKEQPLPPPKTLEEIFNHEPQLRPASDRDRSDNERRARQKVLFMGLLNPFTHFITWTLNREVIDRYDADVVSEKLKMFLNNAVKRYGLVYVILPEYHKDGAIHMHGLISGNMKMVLSGHFLDDGRPIYNMPQWKYGWTTAVETNGNMRAISNYITKYITKSGTKIFGNYYYAGGHGLIRQPAQSWFDVVDYREVEADKEYFVEEAGAAFKYVDEGFANADTYDFEEDSAYRDVLMSYEV